MKQVKNYFLIWISTYCFLFTTKIFATVDKSLIYFDFEKMSVFSQGVYKPNSEGVHSIDPMKAEVSARANGVENITEYLNESCQSLNSKKLSFQSKVENIFRSQGTEIYSDGALKVKLSAPYKSIFQFNTASTLKTSTGEHLVFSIPSIMSAKVLTCGTPALEILNDINQKIYVQIVPINQKSQISSNEKLIKLIFNDQKNSLVVENAQDEIILKNSNISFNETGITFLPVTLYGTQK